MERKPYAMWAAWSSDVIIGSDCFENADGDNILNAL